MFSPKNPLYRGSKGHEVTDSNMTPSPARDESLIVDQKSDMSGDGNTLQRESPREQDIQTWENIPGSLSQVPTMTERSPALGPAEQPEPEMITSSRKTVGNSSQSSASKAVHSRKTVDGPKSLPKAKILRIPVGSPSTKVDEEKYRLISEGNLTNFPGQRANENIIGEPSLTEGEVLVQVENSSLPNGTFEDPTGLSLVGNDESHPPTRNTTQLGLEDLSSINIAQRSVNQTTSILEPSKMGRSFVSKHETPRNVGVAGSTEDTPLSRPQQSLLSVLVKTYDDVLLGTGKPPTAQRWAVVLMDMSQDRKSTYMCQIGKYCNEPNVFVCGAMQLVGPVADQLDWSQSKEKRLEPLWMKCCDSFNQSPSTKAANMMLRLGMAMEWLYSYSVAHETDELDDIMEEFMHLGESAPTHKQSSKTEPRGESLEEHHPQIQQHDPSMSSSPRTTQVPESNTFQQSCLTLSRHVREVFLSKATLAEKVKQLTGLTWIGEAVELDLANIVKEGSQWNDSSWCPDNLVTVNTITSADTLPTIRSLKQDVADLIDRGSEFPSHVVAVALSQQLCRLAWTVSLQDNISSPEPTEGHGDDLSDRPSFLEMNETGRALFLNDIDDMSPDEINEVLAGLAWENPEIKAAASSHMTRALMLMLWECLDYADQYSDVSQMKPNIPDWKSVLRLIKAFRTKNLLPPVPKFGEPHPSVQCLVSSVMGACVVVRQIYNCEAVDVTKTISVNLHEGAPASVLTMLGKLSISHQQWWDTLIHRRNIGVQNMRIETESSVGSDDATVSTEVDTLSTITSDDDDEEEKEDERPGFRAPPLSKSHKASTQGGVLVRNIATTSTAPTYISQSEFNRIQIEIYNITPGEIMNDTKQFSEFSKNFDLLVDRYLKVGNPQETPNSQTIRLAQQYRLFARKKQADGLSLVDQAIIPRNSRRKQEWNRSVLKVLKEMMSEKHLILFVFTNEMNQRLETAWTEDIRKKRGEWKRKQKLNQNFQSLQQVIRVEWKGVWDEIMEPMKTVYTHEMHKVRNDDDMQAKMLHLILAELNTTTPVNSENMRTAARTKLMSALKKVGSLVLFHRPTTAVMMTVTALQEAVAFGNSDLSDESFTTGTFVRVVWKKIHPLIVQVNAVIAHKAKEKNHTSVNSNGDLKPEYAAQLYLQKLSKLLELYGLGLETLSWPVFDSESGTTVDQRVTGWEFLYLGLLALQKDTKVEDARLQAESLLKSLSKVTLPKKPDSRAEEKPEKPQEKKKQTPKEKLDITTTASKMVAKLAKRKRSGRSYTPPDNIAKILAVVSGTPPIKPKCFGCGKVDCRKVNPSCPNFRKPSSDAGKAAYEAWKEDKKQRWNESSDKHKLGVFKISLAQPKPGTQPKSPATATKKVQFAETPTEEKADEKDEATEETLSEEDVDALESDSDSELLPDPLDIQQAETVMAKRSEVNAKYGSASLADAVNAWKKREATMFQDMAKPYGSKVDINYLFNDREPSEGSGSEDEDEFAWLGKWGASMSCDFHVKSITFGNGEQATSSFPTPLARQPSRIKRMRESLGESSAGYSRGSYKIADSSQSHSPDCDEDTLPQWHAPLTSPAVHPKHNVADILTKSDSKATFTRFREVLLGEKSMTDRMAEHPGCRLDASGFGMCSWKFADPDATTLDDLLQEDDNGSEPQRVTAEATAPTTTLNEIFEEIDSVSSTIEQVRQALNLPTDVDAARKARQLLKASADTAVTAVPAATQDAQGTVNAMSGGTAASAIPQGPTPGQKKRIAKRKRKVLAQAPGDSATSSHRSEKPAVRQKEGGASSQSGASSTNRQDRTTRTRDSPSRDRGRSRRSEHHVADQDRSDSRDRGRSRHSDRHGKSRARSGSGVDPDRYRYGGDRDEPLDETLTFTPYRPRLGTPAMPQDFGSSVVMRQSSTILARMHAKSSGLSSQISESLLPRLLLEDQTDRVLRTLSMMVTRSADPFHIAIRTIVTQSLCTRGAVHPTIADCRHPTRKGNLTGRDAEDAVKRAHDRRRYLSYPGKSERGVDLDVHHAPTQMVTATVYPREICEMIASAQTVVGDTIAFLATLQADAGDLLQRVSPESELAGAVNTALANVVQVFHQPLYLARFECQPWVIQSIAIASYGTQCELLEYFDFLLCAYWQELGAILDIVTLWPMTQDAFSPHPRSVSEYDTHCDHANLIRRLLLQTVTKHGTCVLPGDNNTTPTFNSSHSFMHAFGERLAQHVSLGTALLLSSGDTSQIGTAGATDVLKHAVGLMLEGQLSAHARNIHIKPSSSSRKIILDLPCLRLPPPPSVLEWLDAPCSYDTPALVTSAMRPVARARGTTRATSAMPAAAPSSRTERATDRGGGVPQTDTHTRNISSRERGRHQASAQQREASTVATRRIQTLEGPELDQYWQLLGLNKRSTEAKLMYQAYRTSIGQNLAQWIKGDVRRRLQVGCLHCKRREFGHRYDGSFNSSGCIFSTTRTGSGHGPLKKQVFASSDHHSHIRNVSDLQERIKYEVQTARLSYSDAHACSILAAINSTSTTSIRIEKCNICYGHIIPYVVHSHGKKFRKRLASGEVQDPVAMRLVRMEQIVATQVAKDTHPYPSYYGWDRRVILLALRTMQVCPICSVHDPLLKIHKVSTSFTHDSVILKCEEHPAHRLKGIADELVIPRRKLEVELTGSAFNTDVNTSDHLVHQYEEGGASWVNPQYYLANDKRLLFCHVCMAFGHNADTCLLVTMSEEISGELYEEGDESDIYDDYNVDNRQTREDGNRGPPDNQDDTSDTEPDAQQQHEHQPQNTQLQSSCSAVVGRPPWMDHLDRASSGYVLSSFKIADSLVRPLSKERRKVQDDYKILQETIEHEEVSQVDSEPSHIPTRLMCLKNGLTLRSSPIRKEWWFFPMSGSSIGQMSRDGKRRVETCLTHPLPMTVLMKSISNPRGSHDFIGEAKLLSRYRKPGDTHRVHSRYTLCMGGSVAFDCLRTKLNSGGDNNTPVAKEDPTNRTRTKRCQSAMPANATIHSTRPAKTQRPDLETQCPVVSGAHAGPSKLVYSFLHDRKDVFEDFTVNLVNSGMKNTIKRKRDANPLRGTERGIPLPRMKSRTECEDGSIILILDSGAETSVFNTRALLTKEGSDVMRLNSFMGTTCTSEATGEFKGTIKDFSGDAIQCPMGHGGVIKGGLVKDNLLSVPSLQRLGYQFWFGEYPYMITPTGNEIPLYVKRNGYLCLRAHLPDVTPLVSSFSVNAVQQDINYLERDVLLWHKRCMHIDGRTLLYMKNQNLAHGFPTQLKRFVGHRCDCLTCGMGKSSKAHIGPINHANQDKNNDDKQQADECKQTKYYPLEQVHMDCCEMDSPDIYGNKHFLVIVDRATSFMWSIPLVDKADMSLIVERFMQTVVLPYHRSRHKQLLLEYEKSTTTGVLTPPPQLSGLRKIRSDCGSEFLNQGMRALGLTHGFEMDPVAPYVNDGRAEAAVKKLTTAIRCSLIEANLRKPFWGPMMDMACHVLNRMYTTAANGVPYTLLTGLKPNVGYFRVPGCHAVCHLSRKKGGKTSEKAFIGILINYDTAKNTWVFLDPKSGKTVRSAHATFFERARAPEEHIDMDSMLLQPPQFEREVKTSAWRCQLWPNILYPGMDAERISPQNHPVPDDLDKSDSNILFDRDVIKGNTTLETDVPLSEPTPVPVDWSHRPHTNKEWSAWHTLARTSKHPEKAYIRAAVDALDGKTVGEARTMTHVDKEGAAKRYTRADLKYYVARQYLTLTQTPPTETEHINQTTTTQASDEAWLIKNGKRVKGKWMVTPRTYDEWFMAPPTPATATSSTHPETPKVDPVLVQGIVHEIGCRQGFDAPPGKRLRRVSKHAVWKMSSADVPTMDELNANPKSGTYTDATGSVHLTHSIRRTLNGYSKDINKLTVDAVNFVHGIPSDADGGEWVNATPPSSSKKAMGGGMHPMWKQCTMEELSGLFDMGCIEYVSIKDPRVRGALILPSHIVYAAKFTSDVPAQFTKAKARCVAGGNFEPTPDQPFANFSPTAGPCLNRLCDAYAIMYGFSIWSTDCTQAFLNAPTKEDIFVRPPPGCGRPGLIWRLKKFLYGLCAAPAAWMETLSNELIRQGFKAFDDDPCLLRKVYPDGKEIVACVFVDDIKWATNDEEKLKTVIGSIGDKYKISVGKTVVTTATISSIDWSEARISTYLGMRYTHDQSKDKSHTLKVDQTAYIDKLIDRFNIGDMSGKDTPLPCLTAPSQLANRMGTVDDEFLEKWAEEYTFPMIVGSLIHAMVHTRPDIAYAVSILSRYMTNPELHHYKASLYVLRYLKQTRDLGVEYHQENMSRVPTVTATVEHTESDHHHPRYDPVLEAAADASFGDDPETYRSTGGFVVWFGGSPVDYECKRQPLVTMSTLESEYVCASRCVLSIRFLHKFMQFMQMSRKLPTRMHEDNAACVAISHKPVHRMRSKHIGIKYHNVREAVQNREVDLTPIWTEHNVADIFTKSESKATFTRFREVLLGKKSMTDMMAEHPKPRSKGVTCSIQYVENEGSWPQLRLPFSYDSHESEILGVSKVSIPGYDAQFVSMDPDM